MTLTATTTTATVAPATTTTGTAPTATTAPPVAATATTASVVPVTTVSGAGRAGAGPPGAAARRLHAVSARQGELFTRAQARGCGFTAHQIRRRVTEGQWQTVLGPVLTAAPRRLTPALRDRAAQLAMEGSVLAGPSAARRHGIAVRDDTSYLAVRPGRRTRLAGVRLLRDGLSRADVLLVDGTPVTSRPRTVFDCLRVLPEPDATALLDRALRAGWTTPDDLAVRVHRFAGRHGARRLARLSRLAGSGACCVTEQMAVRLLRHARIPGWRTGAQIFGDHGRVGVGGVVFDDLRLVVETDGRAHHVTAERSQRERDRHNRLVAAGWTVLRFTRHDLTVRPGHVRDSIRATVERLAATR